MNKLKILFLSRAYPPVVGGIEMQNFGIAKALSEIADVTIIANTRGKKYLPIFIPIIFLKSFFLASRYDAILLGDGVLSPVGALIKFFHPRVVVIAIVHGLDITYAKNDSLFGKIYKLVNLPSLKKLNRLIMVGNETINQAETAGIPRSLCQFIPNGLDMNEICGIADRKRVESLIGGIDLSQKKIIFRAGRFVKHKGVAWFVRSVMPLLPKDYIFIAAGPKVAKKTAGDNCDFDAAEEAVREMKLENQVYLLTEISREKLKILFSSCDMYISPNIHVPGSMEGFGITAIEAGACGKAVLAANLEGLKDSIKDGQNGFLVEPENSPAWAEKIKELLANDNFRNEFGEKTQKFVAENFGWKKISDRYLEEIQKIINQRR